MLRIYHLYKGKTAIAPTDQKKNVLANMWTHFEQINQGSKLTVAFVTTYVSANVHMWNRKELSVDQVPTLTFIVCVTSIHHVKATCHSCMLNHKHLSSLIDCLEDMKIPSLMPWDSFHVNSLHLAK